MGIEAAADTSATPFSHDAARRLTAGEASLPGLQPSDYSLAELIGKGRPPVIDQLIGVMLETQALMRDAGQCRAEQGAIERQALTDELTGLANRTVLADRLKQVAKPNCDNGFAQSQRLSRRSPVRWCVQKVEWG